MKVKFTKLAALLLSGAALLAAGCTDYEVDIQKNADAIASANDQIKALQSTIATLETAADHKADVDKLNKAISDLETALNGKIADLTTEVGKKLDKTEFETAKKQLTDAIGALSDRVKALEDADFQGQLDALSDKVDKCATKEELQKAVTDLTTYVDGEIAKLKDAVDANAKAIKKINEETIPAINEEIKAIKEKNKAQDETLQLLSDAVEELVALTAGFPENTTIKQYVDNMEATLKQYVQDELKKYVTLNEFNSVKAQLEGRLDGLDKMLKGFGAEEGSVKTYIDGEILKVNNAIKALEEAHAKDIEALNKTIDEVKAQVLAVKTSIRSLVFVPEVYVDGVEAILVSTLHYSPLELKDTNTVNENAVAKDTVLNVTPPSIAKYHVIPSNADLDFLHVGDTVKFVVRENDPFIVTRANATDDFKVVGIYQGRDTVETDCINVRVDVTGLPATDKNISVVALQLTKDDETYTSDYATVFSEDINDVRIADPTNVEDDDAHYRRATEVISGTDAEAFLNVPVWTDTFDTLSVDHQMAYDEAFNVKEYVIAHFIQGQECRPNEKTFEGLGFTWKFELVEDYDFCDYDLTNLTDEGVLTVKDANAINTTPIVRVTIKDGDNNVQIAYVKVWVAPTNEATKIVWSKKEPFDVDDQFEFKCEGDTLYADSTLIKAKIQKNGEEVLLKDITWKNFVAAYPEFVDAVDPMVDTMGTVKFENDSLKWVMTPEQLWKIAGNPTLDPKETIVITHNVAFKAENNAQVVITLVADVKPVNAYKIPVERYIESYWTTGIPVPGVKEKYGLNNDFIEGDKYEFALYNVYTSGAGDRDSLKCLFDNNINAAFFTDETGVINLKEIPELGLPAVGEPGVEITGINYFFCKEMEDIEKIGDFKVEFEVSDDSLSLLATIKNAKAMNFPELENVQDTIAKINNEAGATPNIVSLNKKSKVAKALLNTMKYIGEKDGHEVPSAGELYIYIGAVGTVCGDDNGEGGFEVNLYWPKAMKQDGQYNPDDWQDHFAAKYRQPVYLSESAGDDFIDAVDFGEGGSFITIKDLVNPKDWRARPFEPQKNGKANPVDGIDYFSSLWDYYGPIDIQIDTTNITCNLGTGGVVIKLPVTIEVKTKVSADDLKAQIADLTLPYRDKYKTNDSGLTIEEMIDALAGNAGDYGFFTYKNNGTNVTRDFEMYVPVELTYGWGVLRQTITVNVYRTLESFEGAHTQQP